jgi:hypothetical protein
MRGVSLLLTAFLMRNQVSRQMPLKLFHEISKLFVSQYVFYACFSIHRDSYFLYDYLVFYIIDDVPSIAFCSITRNIRFLSDFMRSFNFVVFIIHVLIFRRYPLYSLEEMIPF